MVHQLFNILNTAEGDTRCQDHFLQLLDGLGGAPSLNLRLEGGVVVAALKVRDKAGVLRQLRPAHHVAELGKHLIGAAGENKHAVLCLEGVKGGDGLIAVAAAGVELPQNGVVDDEVIHDVDHGVHHGNVHRFAHACRGP